jgi:FKBP-type peptidyl-prolyl cis-trans isomerase
MQLDLCAAAAIGLGALNWAPAPERASIVPLLTFEEIREGTGLRAESGDRVTLEFVITSADGREIANSVKRGLAFTLELGAPRGARALSEAIGGMREGGARRVRFDSDAFFGPLGVPPILSLGMSLVAEVRVTRVQKRRPTASASAGSQR